MEEFFGDGWLLLLVILK